jgi:hypothetical protein
MVDQDTIPDLEAVNRALAATGQPFKLALIPLDQLRLLDKNARYMPHEMFQNLVANIKRDKGLSSVPFCWFDGSVYHVLSGNHRVKAAQAAGLTHVLVLFDDRLLGRQEFVARQLAHNAIAGKDDAAILRDLWAEIEDVSLKYYAGLDDKTLEQMADASLAALSEARLDYRLLSFLFLPEEVDRLQEAFRRARETIPAEDVVILRVAEFSRLIHALGKVQASFNVHNGATALLLILEIFERHYEELRAGYWREDGKPKHKGKVPLASVFGTDQVPAATAMLLGRVLDTMLAQGDIEKEDLGKALERMAHKYLGI